MTGSNIRAVNPLPTPAEVKLAQPLSVLARATVSTAREGIVKILLGEDRRLLAVVGPCSIHKTAETLEYAKKMVVLANEVKDQLLVVMRFCGDKPRTGKAWTGFLNDPFMDGSYDIVHGWSEGRRLALEILNLGLPLGWEFLDAENFQRLSDIPSYTWIGARDVGSQRQRQLASGLEVPVGLKNHNFGGIDVALDAISVASVSNVLVANDDNGRPSRFITLGNHAAHLIHRGTETGPNYDAANIESSVRKLTLRGFIPRIVVDASHGNSQKDYRRQATVIRDVVDQAVYGNHIAGFMYESFLKDGKQSIPKNLSNLLPGVSVTDGCDGWERTEEMLREAHLWLSRR